MFHFSDFFEGESIFFPLIPFVLNVHRMEQWDISDEHVTLLAVHLRTMNGSRRVLLLSKHRRYQLFELTLSSPDPVTLKRDLLDWSASLIRMREVYRAYHPSRA